MSDVETPEAPRSSQRPPSIVRKPSVEVPSSNASYNGRSQSRASPPPTVDPRTASRRFAVIMCGILIIICLGIVAIVLPFFLGDDCNCPRSSEAGGPAASSAPEATPAPTPVREEVTQRFRQFVDNYATDISGGEPFEDPGSPQYRAAQFIADDYDFTQEITDLSQLNDLYALAVFYYSTQGDSWRQCSQESTNCGGESWMDPQVGHCNWNYVTCDDAGRVTGIVFGTEGNNLDGPLPLELGLLLELQRFIADNNNITGNVPIQISQLTNVQRFILSSNAVSGTLPGDFLINSGNSLQILRLDGNNFSGEIPSTAIDEYSNASVLAFESNSFTGSISSTTCARIGESQVSLQEFTVDCNEVSCDCCTNC